LKIPIYTGLILTIPLGGLTGKPILPASAAMAGVAISDDMTGKRLISIDPNAVAAKEPNNSRREKAFMFYLQQNVGREYHFGR